MERNDAENELSRLREAIDRVDEVLVRLLNQRAKYAIEIGEIKGILGLPVYAPEREKEVLLHVEKTCEGPLDAPSISRLFERIIDESRRIERECADRLQPVRPAKAGPHTGE
jgi:chorismate mutase